MSITASSPQCIDGNKTSLLEVMLKEAYCHANLLDSLGYMSCVGSVVSSQTLLDALTARDVPSINAYE